MANNFIQVETYRANTRFEASGSITRLVQVPEIVDCNGVIPAGFVTNPNDLWCNQRCGNDKFYAQPIPNGQNIKLQTRFWDTKNFRTISGVSPECEGVQQGTALWSFWIVDAPGTPWGQRIGSGGCPSGFPPLGIQDGVWAIYYNGSSQCSGSASQYDRNILYGCISIGCYTNFDNWANSAFQHINPAVSAPCFNLFNGIALSATITQTTYAGQNAYKVNVVFDLAALKARYGADNCERGFCNVVDINNANQSAFPKPYFVSDKNMLCCDTVEPVQSPCYLFGYEGCNEAQEGVARFIFEIQDNPSIVYGAVNQGIAGVTDGGFIFDILNTSCELRKFEDIPALLLLSNATDYEDYIANVLTWLTAYVVGFGTSTVAESDGVFTINWGIGHFEGLGIEICNIKPAICPIANEGCSNKATQSIGFVIESNDTTASHTYTIKCGETIVTTVAYNHLSGSLASQISAKFNTILNADGVFEGNYFRAIWQTATYSDWCNCDWSIESPTDNSLQFTQIDENQCCATDCCQQIDGYVKFDIPISQSTLNNMSDNFLDIVPRLYCGNTFIEAYASYYITEPTYEALVYSFQQSMNNGTLGDVFARAYVVDGLMAGISLYVGTGELGGCSCNEAVIVFVLNGERFYSLAPECCETECDIPCDVSYVQINFTGLRDLEYDNPDNNVCLHLLNEGGTCPEICDSDVGICIGEYNDMLEFLAYFRDYLINKAIGGNQKGFVKLVYNYAAGTATFDVYLPRDVYPCPNEIELCQVACFVEPECEGIVRYSTDTIVIAPGLFCNWTVTYQCVGPSYSPLFNMLAISFTDLADFVATFNARAIIAGVGINAYIFSGTTVYFEFDCEWAEANCSLDCGDWGNLRIFNTCGLNVVMPVALCTLAGGGSGEPQTIDFALSGDGELQCCDVDTVAGAIQQMPEIEFGNEPNPLCCPPFAFKFELTDCCGIVQDIDPMSSVVNQYAAKYNDSQYVQGLEIDPETLPPCFGIKLSSDAGETLYSECYIKECCLPLVRVCGIWSDSDTDCDGNIYNDYYDEICGEWIRHEDCIWVYGELKYIGFNVDSSSDNQAGGKTLSNKYKFNTGLIPPYVAEQLSRKLMAPKVSIDGKEFEVDQQSFNEERPTQQMLRLSIELTLTVCERVEGC